MGLFQDALNRLFPSSFREGGSVVPEEERAARLRQKSAERAENPQVIPTSRRATTSLTGLADRNKPTDQQIRQHNVSLFAKLVGMRAHATAQAIVGRQGQAGFQVQRLEAGEFEAVSADQPWQRLIRRPNPDTPPYLFWWWASTVIDLQGAVHFLVSDGPAGQPEALWPIFPEWGEVRPRLGDKGQVNGWVYYRGGERKTYEARDIIRLRLPDSVNMQETQSLLEQGIYELDRELYHNNYERDFLEEGRPPNVYLSFDNDVSVKANQEAADKVQQRHMGKRANKVPALGNGGEMKTVALSPDDLQMLESRQMNERRLFTICGVPQALFKSESSNRSTGEAAHWTFAKYTIQPRAISLADQQTKGMEQAFRADPGALRVQAPDVTPRDKEEEETINDLRVRRGVPPAQIMREQGEEVPDEYEEDLETPRLPSTLKKVSGGDGATGEEASAPPGFL
jgi:hypothetical protein